jgi:hypothetical protein
MALASDIAGVLDVDWALSTVDGFLALAQQILRRLTTPLGELEDDPTYGFDIRGLVGAPLTASIIEARVLEQIYAEEEVQRAAVRATQSADGILIEMRVQAITGTGSLTLNASTLGVTALLNGTPFALEPANDTTAAQQVA